MIKKIFYKSYVIMIFFILFLSCTDNSENIIKGKQALKNYNTSLKKIIAEIKFVKNQKQLDNIIQDYTTTRKKLDTIERILSTRTNDKILIMRKSDILKQYYLENDKLQIKIGKFIYNMQKKLTNE